MIKLFPYQEDAVKGIEKFNGRCLLALEMGLGKSVSALYWAQKYNKFPAIVVCPASLKWMWQNEASKHLGLLSEVLEGTKPLKKRIETTHPIIIINYDILGPWLPFLKEWGPQTIIIDECSAICNRKTKRSKNVKELCKGIPHVLALSGTPLTNRPAELWPALNLIRPDLYGKWWEFATNHTSPKRMPWGWVFNGAVKLDILHRNLLQQLMVRKLKKDVLKDLPKKQRIVVPVPMDNPGEYKDALNDFQKWINKVSPAKAKKASKAETLVKIGYLRRLAGKLKLKQVFNWVDDFLENSDGKLILFAIHKAIIQELEKRYKKICVVVDGSVKGQDRQIAVDTFQNDVRYRIFIGNIKAAGMGITLVAANTLAFVEIGWTPGEMTQAAARCICKGTPVLTPHGWRRIENVKIGDTVISHTGKHQKVLDTWSKGADKYIADVCITGSLWTLSTTWDHKYLMRNGRWKMAGDLKPGDQLAMPENSTVEELKSIPFEGERIKDFFYNNWGALQENSQIRHAPAKIDVTDDFLFTMGYFAGDGYTSKTGSNIGICGNDYNKQEALEICARWFQSQGFPKANRYQREGGRGVVDCYYSKEWAGWFRSHFGSKARYKKLAQFLLTLNKRQSQIVLSGLARSDGYQKKNEKRISYSTLSNRLSSHVFLLAQRAGHRPGITITKIEQKIITWGGGEGPRSAGIVQSVTLRNKKKINGLRERVFDLTIEEDKSFVIGNAIVHNCDRIGQTKKISEYWLIAKGSIEEKLCSIIQKKQKVLDATLDGKYETKSDMDVFDLLTAELTKETNSNVD